MSGSGPKGSVRAAPVELFSTSILGNHKVRSRHERFVSVLTIKKVPYVYHDLASDEDAKSRWRRKVRRLLDRREKGRGREELKQRLSAGKVLERDVAVCF